MHSRERLRRDGSQPMETERGRALKVECIELP